MTKVRFEKIKTSHVLVNNYIVRSYRDVIVVTNTATRITNKV